jgi:hypothetical protein
LLIFDNTFTNPPSTAAPIVLVNSPNNTQALIHSRNTSTATTTLINPGANSSIYEVIGGIRGPSSITASTSFFHKTAFVPSSIIDVKTDYGAVGNNSVDDTNAIRNAILHVARLLEGSPPAKLNYTRSCTLAHHQMRLD